MRTCHHLACSALALSALLPSLSAQQLSTRFVSVPDFINMDLQFEDPRLFDLTAAQQALLVAQVNSGGAQAAINPHVGDFIGTVENGYRGASQVLLEAIGAESADFFTISGDMLYTRWPTESQLGSTGAAQHIITQADIYYDGWIDSVRIHSGFDHAAGDVFTVVGDHEVGDNNWPSQKRALLPTYRQVYVAKLGNPVNASGGAYVTAPAGLEGRTYAVQRGNLLLVGVDQFATISSNTGPIDVTGAQLGWLDATLARASADSSIDHIVVLGHVPIAKPGSVRVGLSSGLMNDSSENGPLWQTLVRHGVDLYLPGEVHDISMQEAGGVLQVVTGTNIFQQTGSGRFNQSVPFDPNNPLRSEQNYMVVESWDDRLELTIKQIDTVIWGYGGRDNDPLNDDPYKRREARVEQAAAQAGFRVIGTLTIDTSGPDNRFLNRTGVFVSRWPNPPVFAAADGSIPLDMGTGFSPVAAGQNSINQDGSRGGVIDVSFATSAGGQIESRDRGPLQGGTADSDLARDFVFGVRSAGASHLDVRIAGLSAGRYRFEGVFHDALSTSERDPVDLDIDTGSGFVHAARTQVTVGPSPTTLGTASFEFDASSGSDVVVRITNLDNDGPHLITGLRLLPVSGTQASATPIPTTCVGPYGSFEMTATSLPWTGSTYWATVTGLGPRAVGVWVLGLTPQQLPLATLHPVGLPGCELLAAPDLTLPASPFVGRAFFQLPIPADPALAGGALWHHFIQVDLDLQGRLTSLSNPNGLALVIGTR